MTTLGANSTNNSTGNITSLGNLSSFIDTTKGIQGSYSNALYT